MQGFPLPPQSSLFPTPSEGRLEADRSDAHAIRTFLGIYRARSAHTQRAYETECRKFLLWLAGQRPPGYPDTMLCRMDALTAQAYLEHLQNGSSTSKKLGRASIERARSVLFRLFEVLKNLDAGDHRPFCDFNPFALTQAPKASRGDVLQRALTPEEWACVREVLDALPETTARERAHKLRARWIFSLLYYTFMRRSEAAALRMNDFRLERDGWCITFVGKGSKRATIVACDALMEDLKDYRTAHGLTPLPAFDEDLPAILPVTGARAKGVTDQLIYLVCREVFRTVVERHPRLARASTHWMRHTGISHAMEADTPPRYVQAQARHASLVVTARYDHKERRNWRTSLKF